MKKSGAFHRLRGMVQLVKDLVIDDDGNATCTAVSDDEEEDKYAPTVGYHFGFYSRPSNARGVIIKADGQGNTSFLIGFRDKQYEMTLSKGEVGIQNEFGANLLLDKNGIVNINGTDYSLIKTEDLFTDMKAFISAVIADLASAAAAPVGTYAATVNTTALFIKMVTGSGTAYKSTKAKNG